MDLAFAACVYAMELEARLKEPGQWVVGDQQTPIAVWWRSVGARVRPAIRQAFTWWSSTDRHDLHGYVRPRWQAILDRQAEDRQEYENPEGALATIENRVLAAAWALVEMPDEFDRTISKGGRRMEECLEALREYHVHKVERLLPLAQAFEAETLGVSAERLDCLPPASRKQFREGVMNALAADAMRGSIEALLRARRAALENEGLPPSEIDQRIVLLEENLNAEAQRQAAERGMIL